MPSLKSHRDFQTARNLGFCYLCGKPFGEGDEADFDHVPPKTIFAKSHRQDPLVLRTHRSCNQSQSDWDQVTGDFISVIHETDRTRQKLRKHIKVVSAERKMLALQGVPLKRIVGRFLRGFHAALYNQFLPYETKSAIQLPFPEMRQTDQGYEFERSARQYPAFIEVLKKNRIAGNVDEVICYSGHCRYFCVWSELDDRTPICLFALRLYEWEKLADSEHFPRRACAGSYSTGEVPKTAARETAIEIPCGNLDPLDPFAD